MSQRRILECCPRPLNVFHSFIIYRPLHSRRDDSQKITRVLHNTLVSDTKDAAPTFDFYGRSSALMKWNAEGTLIKSSESLASLIFFFPEPFGIHGRPQFSPADVSFVKTAASRPCWPPSYLPHQTTPIFFSIKDITFDMIGELRLQRDKVNTTEGIKWLSQRHQVQRHQFNFFSKCNARQVRKLSVDADNNEKYLTSLLFLQERRFSFLLGFWHLPKKLLVFRWFFELETPGQWLFFYSPPPRFGILFLDAFKIWSEADTWVYSGRWT